MEELDTEEQNTEREEAIVRLRLISHNARLVDARKALGLTQAGLSQMLDINVDKLCAFETVRAIPNAHEAEEISTFFGVSIDYLFPEVIINAVKLDVFNRKKCVAELTPSRVEELNFHNASRLLSSDAIETAERNVNREQLKKQLEESLSELTPQERQVIELRFGLRTGKTMTLAEIGEIYGVIGERIRQIEGKALRKLRYTKRGRTLKLYCE